MKIKGKKCDQCVYYAIKTDYGICKRYAPKAAVISVEDNNSYYAYWPFIQPNELACGEFVDIETEEEMPDEMIADVLKRMNDVFKSGLTKES